MNQTVQVVKRQLALYLVLMLLATAVLLLAGCGADIDQSVTFYRNEQWSAEIKLGMPAEMMALLGSSAEIEEQLDEFVVEARNLGANASWKSSREGTTIIYTIQTKGEGYDALNQIVFGGDAYIQAIDENGKRQIYFSQPVNRGLLDANQYTVTLAGGEIISSNGLQLEPGSVQWVNPSGYMEAVLTEKSRFNVGLWLLVIVVAAGIGGGGWFFLKQQTQQPAPPVRFCVHCGQPVGSQTRFCPNCGQPQA